MVKLREPFYLPGPHEPANVLMWGKSSEQTEEDLTARVARLGGNRTPDYGQAYLLAANTLLRTALEARTLDHHGLPIFYLQRHAAELIIKAPLHLGHEIQRYRQEFGNLTSDFPAYDLQVKRINKTHDLNELLGFLDTMASALTVGPVPEVLRTVVKKITAAERNEATFSRYSFHMHKQRDGSQRLVNHVKDEVVFQLGQLQELLLAANDAVGVIWPARGQLMSNLGELWEVWAREAGVIEVGNEGCWPEPPNAPWGE